MAKAISRHYEILGDVVARHDGVRPTEQGEGDSIVAAFGRGADAVAATLDAQRAFAAEPWPAGVELSVRMALHTGDAQQRDAFNYFGQTVIRTARLRSLAHGGQVIRRATTDRWPTGSRRAPTGVTLGSTGSRTWVAPSTCSNSSIQTWSRTSRPCSASTRQARTCRPSGQLIGRERELLAGRKPARRAPDAHDHGSRRMWQDPSGAAARGDRADRSRTASGASSSRRSPARPTSSAGRSGARCDDDPDRSLLDVLVDRLRDWSTFLVLDNCEHVLDPCAS